MVITKPTLLILDDDASIRNKLTLIFVELGYWVRSAPDGFAILALTHESKRDILLSDINMPGMSGFEMLSVVRRAYPEIDVIAMSGVFPGKTVPRAIAADAFYEKATSLSFLFDASKQIAQPDWSIRRSTENPAPLLRNCPDSRVRCWYEAPTHSRDGTNCYR